MFKKVANKWIILAWAKSLLNVESLSYHKFEPVQASSPKPGEWFDSMDMVWLEHIQRAYPGLTSKENNHPYEYNVHEKPQQNKWQSMDLNCHWGVQQLLSTLHSSQQINCAIPMMLNTWNVKLLILQRPHFCRMNEREVAKNLCTK